MPMTVLEAMAVGIPVVATRVGEIPYIIEHGINGFVLNVDAPIEAFVELLHELLDAERREKFGENARQKVVDCCQEDAMVQRYKTIIQSLS
jgi:glycosyltransferase involved in cell wall biosynthesis